MKKRTRKADRPAPPAALNTEELAEWNRVCGELDDLGRLNKVDRAILHVYVKVWATFHTASAHVDADGPVTTYPNGMQAASPYWKVQKETGMQLRGLLSKLGLTPAARDFDKVNKQPELDDLEF